MHCSGHRVSVLVGDPLIHRRLTGLLRGAGHGICRCCEARWSPSSVARCGLHSVVIANAADIGGFAGIPEAIVSLRRVEHAPPLILLTREEAPPEEIVLALEAGADDVVPAGIQAPVLLAKIRAYLRRLAGASGSTSTLITSPRCSLRLDVKARRPYVMSREGRWKALPVLTPSESMILSQFLRAPGVVFERRTLIAALADGDGDIPLPNLVDKHIQSLRRKLSRAASGIRSVYGRGYVYSEER